LNPHLLHGKQVRYLYAMNAWLEAELSKIIRAPGGIRTHAMRIKSPPCCLLHHDPMKRSGVCVSSGVSVTSSVLLFGLLVSGSPENRTRPGAVISRVWTTSPRLPFSPEALIFHLISLYYLVGGQIR
jgi:hypothetical protein